MKPFTTTILLTAALFCTQLAMANNGKNNPGNPTTKEDGVVHGYVVDANSKRPVAGVVVAASHSKKNIRKEVSTNAAGYFKLEEMPAGELLIYFDKKGYRMIKKTGLLSKDAGALKFNIDLLEEELDTVYEHPALRLLDGIF